MKEESVDKNLAKAFEFTTLEKEPTFEPIPVKEAEHAAEETADEIAFKQGWRPKEEFKGNPNDWVDAKTFVDRAPWAKKIKQLQEKIDDLYKVNEQIQANFTKAEERAYKKAMRELEAQKAQAKLQNNVDAYDYALKQENSMKDEYSINKTPVQQLKPEDIAISNEFKSFSAQNSWVSTTNPTPKESAMRGFSANCGLQYEKAHPNAKLQDVLDYVHAEVRKEFPNYVGFKGEDLEVNDDGEEDEIEDKMDRAKTSKNIKSSTPARSAGGMNVENFRSDVYKSKEMEFERATENCDVYVKQTATMMFKEGQDWKTYIKHFTGNKSKRGNK